METINNVIFKRKLQLSKEDVVEAPQSKDLNKYSTTYLELREKLKLGNSYMFNSNFTKFNQLECCNLCFD